MNKYLQIFSFLFILLFSSVETYAQEVGLPFTANYSPATYKAGSQNWAVVQDNRGMIYVGNTNGLLEFDGKNWVMIPIGNNLSVTSLAVDTHGVVYVGSYGEFGYLTPDPKSGKMHYISLSDNLDEKDKNFTDIWKTHVGKDGIYFQSYKSIIRYNQDGHKIWKPTNHSPDANFHFSFMVGNQLYVREHNLGLCRLEHDTLKLVKAGEAFAQKRIYTILPYDESGKMLIGTETDGLFMYDPNDHQTPFFSLYSEANEYLMQHKIYHGISYLNAQGKKRFALATIRGGLVILDENGQFVEIIDRTNIRDDMVLHVFKDNQNALWLGLNNGISRVEAYSALRYWDESAGLEGNVQSVIRYQNTLFAATGAGVYYLEDNRFHPVSGINSQTWNLLHFESEDRTKKELMVSTNSGIYEIKKDSRKGFRAEKISSYDSFVLYQSRIHKNKIYVGLSDGLAVMGWKNNAWFDYGKVKEPVGVEVRSVTEDKQGNTWIGTTYSGVFMLKLDEQNDTKPLKIIEYNAENMNDVQIHAYLGDLMLLSPESGLFVYDETTKKFKPETKITKLFSEKGLRGLLQFTEDKDDNFWLNIYNSDKHQIHLIEHKKDENGHIHYLKDSVYTNRMPNIRIHTMYSESNGFTWIGTVKGLLRYNTLKVVKRSEHKFPAIIRKIYLNNDSLLFAGNHGKEVQSKLMRKQYVSSSKQSKHQILKIPYENNSLIFHFSALSYDQPSANQFSYYLEGHDEKWSTWTTETKKEYTNLPHGKYTFRVRAKNIHNVVSTEATYQFRIKAPWYDTYVAYIFYFILVVLFVRLLIWFNSRRLEKEKNELENTVAKRTAEIQEKNDFLEKQKNEISRKTKQLEKQKNELEEQHMLLEAKNEQITKERDKTQRAYDNINLLSDIGKQITSTLAIENIRRIVYDNISARMNVNVFGIGLYLEDGKLIDFQNFIDNQKERNFQVSIADENDLSVWSLYNREEVIIKNYIDEYKYYIPNAPFPGRKGFPQSVICLPLSNQSKSLGVMTVQSYDVEAFSSNDINLLKNLAVYVGIAIDNADSYQQIANQHQIIEEKNIEISKTSQDIIKSINYASRIQSAMLPQPYMLQKHLPNSFIFWQPRDVVSGDFYWFSKVQHGGTHKLVIAAVDCTGHGVPGAFMSMIGNDLLNHIVNRRTIVSPEKILNEMHIGVIKGLKQVETNNRDGMDMSLCVVDQSKHEVSFAGAKNILLYIRDHQVHEIKGDKHPIGLVRKEISKFEFQKHVVKIDQPTWFYIFSDGYQDQFGGEKSRKYMKKRMKEFLLLIYKKLPDFQHKLLKDNINDWKGRNIQTDDILVIGFQA